MRSPRREFWPARDARYHRITGGLPTLVRWTNMEDDDAQRILAQYTYTMTSSPFFGDLYVSCEAWRRPTLWDSRASQFRWVPLENIETVTSWHLWLDNTAYPLRCKPISFLLGFIWIQDLMQSKECHHPIENEKSFPLMSDMTRYDEMKKNCGRSKMWSAMLSCTIDATGRATACSFSLVFIACWATTSSTRFWNPPKKWICRVWCF